MYEETHVVLVSEPHKTRSLSVCGQLPIGRSPYKDQVLVAWVILAQNSLESHIFLLSTSLGKLCGCCWGVHFWAKLHMCK
jgi:hypothetical protein